MDQVRHILNLYHEEVLAVLAGIVGLALINDIRTGRLGIGGLLALLTMAGIGVIASKVLMVYLRWSRGPE
jgi:hypothetical protein